MGTYVDLVDQQIRIFVENDVQNAVEADAIDDWKAGKILDLHEYGVSRQVHLGRVAHLRVLSDETPIEDTAGWVHLKVRHWTDVSFS